MLGEAACREVPRATGRGILHKLGIAETGHAAQAGHCRGRADYGSTGKRRTGNQEGGGGGGEKQPQTPPEMFLQRLLLTKLNIMPTDKGEVLGATFTGRV